MCGRQQARDLEEDALSTAMAAVVACSVCRATAFKEFRVFEQTLQKELDQSAEKVRTAVSACRGLVSDSLLIRLACETAFFYQKMIRMFSSHASEVATQ